jgi:hypothetical protein
MKMMDSTTDPRAIQKLLNQIRYTVQTQYDQSQKWPQFKSAVEAGKLPGYDLGDFYSWYNSQLDPSKLPSATGGGLNLGPVKTVKGANEKKSRPPLSSFFTK